MIIYWCGVQLFIVIFDLVLRSVFYFQIQLAVHGPGKLMEGVNHIIYEFNSYCTQG